MKPTCSILFATATLLASSCQQPNEPKMKLENRGDTTAIQITSPTKYILLPVQEDQPEARVRLNTGSEAEDVWMDVRLAHDSVDYYVPFKLSEGATARVDVLNLPQEAIAWKQMQLSDEFDTTNREYYRPLYHFTPAYGWMNDPNGMCYMNGEYHLFFQYNPYGSKWGNMHWGHAVSTDMIHWTELEPAIARDNYGHIFSGSSYIARIAPTDTPSSGENVDPFVADCLVPGNGTEGDFIASYYTSDNSQLERPLQEQQSFAISMDGGRTYRKYGAPVLKSDGRRDFRDPKLFWCSAKNEWRMIVSADNEMQFYGSKNLRDWTYISAFGDGYGVQPRQFECPDFFSLPVENEKNSTKYVMIVNVNPGCWFGGSASQYFTGSYDGIDFKCDNAKETVKWLDWGKDHYAAVTFSCEPQGRVISIPWMSNWQYANELPTKQYRSQMGMPRELFAFTQGKETYVGQRPVAEMQSLKSESCKEFDIKPGQTLHISNDEGEYVTFTLNEGKLICNRNNSGVICSPDFAVETWVPVAQLCGKKSTYHLELWLDTCSMELFVEGGRASMTNLVFPTAPYNHFEIK